MAEALFFSAWNEGSTGRSWMDFGEMSNYKTHYEWSKWFLAGTVALNGIFLYYPELKEVLRHLPKALDLPEFLEDCTAFQKLGLEPGNWSEVERAYSARPSEKQAYLRLTRKIRDKVTWSAAQIESLAESLMAQNDVRGSLLKSLLIRIPETP